MATEDFRKRKQRLEQTKQKLAALQLRIAQAKRAGTEPITAKTTKKIKP
jgi:hypothetical protein